MGRAGQCANPRFVVKTNYTPRAACVTEMSERLYYFDAYTTHFQATLVERLTWADRPAVALDRTYFYPTSGGQPHDRGTINGRPVLDVVIRPSDGAIIHVLDDAVTGEEISAEIDWPRRFDHMQQHTGQHILSQACLRLVEAETIGFHLGDAVCTIDLATSQLTATELARIEELANTVVWENRPIHARLVSHTEALHLPLRKIPPVDGDQLRLVDIADFDLTACGGTHVAQTGAVGLIKIIRLERMRGQVRLLFLCGRRAVADYDAKNSLALRLAADFTCSAEEVPAAVGRLRAEVKAAQRAARQAQSDALAYEAQTHLARGARLGDVTLVTHVFSDRRPDEVRGLANALAQQPGVVALLGLAGPNAQLMYARAQDAPGAMQSLLTLSLSHLGPARGGGNPVYAQGGGVVADVAQVQTALQIAADHLRAEIQT